LDTVCVIEQVQGQHDWIMATGYSCRFMDQEKVNKQKRNNQQAWPIRDLFCTEQENYCLLLNQSGKSQAAKTGPSNSFRWLIRTQDLLHFPSHVTCHKINDRLLLLMKLS